MRAQLAIMLIFVPIIADTLVTVIRRTLTGYDPTLPHFDFYYQRMALAGWPKRHVVLLHWLAIALWGTLGYVLA